MDGISLVIGGGAAALALWVRRALVVRLGQGWLVRYVLVQAMLINVALLAILTGLAQGLGLAQGPGRIALPVAYGVLFFFYSLSNIDWTAKKFHTEQGETP